MAGLHGDCYVHVYHVDRVNTAWTSLSRPSSSNRQEIWGLTNSLGCVSLPPVLLQSAPSSISYSSLESPDMTSSPPFWNPTPLSVRVIPSCTGTTSWSPVRTRSFISAFFSDVGRVIGRQFLQFRILRYCFYRTSPQQCCRDTDTAIISVRLSVRPSVCLSVTFRHCIETASHVIILSSAYASPVIRVSLALNSFAKFRRGHHYGAAEYTYGI